MDKYRVAKAYNPYTLWVEIDDLHIPCAVPTLEMTERIMERAKLVTELAGGAITQEGYDLAFELLAELLSCNHNFIRYKADELKKKRISITQIIGLLTEWVNFIGELANLKN